MADPWAADGKKNLDGFSSNNGWENPDGLSSSHPVQPGPATGLAPIQPGPAREQLWTSQSEAPDADDATDY